MVLNRLGNTNYQILTLPGMKLSPIHTLLHQATNPKLCCVGRMMAGTLGQTSIGRRLAELVRMATGRFGDGWA
jgi:hypothetical protein